MNKEIASLIWSSPLYTESATYDKNWHKYNIEVPVSATTMSISITGVANWHVSSGRGKTLRPYIYVKFLVDDSERVGEFLFVGASLPTSGNGTKTNSNNTTIKLNNNSKVSILIRFDLKTSGYYNYEVQDQKSAWVTLNSITSDTNVDTVISRGTVGFIAIDPNSCPYTVTKG